MMGTRLKVCSRLGPALWHPLLIHDAQRMPSWERADSPPEDTANRLIVIPHVSESLLLAGWPARAKKEGACVIRKTLDRQTIVDRALEARTDESPTSLDPEIVADFLALGLCYLQEELLTRQMRYMSNLDEVHFQSETVDAANAAVAGDAEKTKHHLQNCFDVLTEARERFYPAESYLIDLTLLAPTTLGPPLEAAIRSGVPINLLASSETIQHMAEQHPQMLSDLKQAVDAGNVTIVGGEQSSRELPLLPLEVIRAELAAGAKICEQYLGFHPEIYGRRRAGLTPVLPQILSRSGFAGALHLTLDDGQFPRGEQCKIRWEGIDSSSIDALAQVPLDAARGDSFLSFPEKMGHSMDLDHVAATVFAHWPGQASPWYDDMRRVAKYSPVMGRFVTLDTFFRDTESPGFMSKFSPDSYRVPYLKQAIIRRQENALSHLANVNRLVALGSNLSALSTVVQSLSGKPDPNAAAWQTLISGTWAPDVSPDAEPPLTDALQAAANTFATKIPRTAGAGRGYLVVNPSLFSQRVGVRLEGLDELPAVEGPIKAVQATGPRCAVVDVPALGYTWVGGTSAAPAGRSTKEKPLADPEEMVMRNEFFELSLDQTTGGIRALYDYKQRGNRLSQQLAFRLPAARPRPGEVWRDPDLEAVYSKMVADSVEITSTGPALAAATTRGKLLDPEGKVLANFTQEIEIWRSSPVIRLDIELDVQEPPRADPWNSYYASRVAWSDAGADLLRGTNNGTFATDAKRIEAPLFVEARGERQRTTILSGGLPYHRRIGMRMLDTLLSVRGETCHKFRLGLAIDAPNPMTAALGLLAPPVVVPDGGAAPQGPSSSWLFHIDSRNITATHWEPLVEADAVVGYRVRLVETAGRMARTKLRSFHAPKTARQIDFRGRTLVELPVEEDAVHVDFSAHEWVEVEARWA